MKLYEKNEFEAADSGNPTDNRSSHDSSSLRAWARRLKRETHTLLLVAKHPDLPWYVRLFAGLVLAYAFSPIDLIPDFIPILGYLDDLILLPLGIALCIRLTPPEILSECRARAEEEEKAISYRAGNVDGSGFTERARRSSRLGILLVIGVWIMLGILLMACAGFSLFR
jgi:uncharacterized membrane protein YkvA (DUF1232 family)